MRAPKRIDGLLLIDKPAGLSSAGAVNVVKRLLPRGTRIGHAGTLDPFATGLLVLLIGKSTKLCEKLMSEPKSYSATVKLGVTTATDDPESPELPSSMLPPIDLTDIESALAHFRGTIMQRPPAYSALKIAGRRAYELAREGARVELNPRAVTIHRVEIVSFQFPMLQLEIDCSRGTYIRSIARDLGERLGTGAYLAALRRTRVGSFRVEQAAPLAQLTSDTLASTVLQL